uniref:DNA-directed RNA polymerase subunit n=1 Tax=Corethrella appendiculata TaxID=1370023 RepID=U5EQG9_9DIPT
MENSNHTIPGFCPNCGSILPMLTQVGNVRCFACLSTYNASVFGNMKAEYTIEFNTISNKIQNQIKPEKGTDGPIVERKCPKCGNNRMSYATLQLRSADEGQTVFFTCTKCKFKESENS